MFELSEKTVDGDIELLLDRFYISKGKSILKCIVYGILYILFKFQ